MANTLLDPLAVATAAGVSNVGTPAAPLGDSAGVNPFEGRSIPGELNLSQPTGDAGPGTPTPPPVPTGQPAVAPTIPAPPPPAQPSAVAVPDPFEGRSIPDSLSAQGTAPATTAGSIDTVAGIGTPASSSDPFEGRTIPDSTVATPPVQGGSATSRAMAAVNPNPNLSKDPNDWTDLQRQVVGLPPKAAPESATKAAIVGTYQTVKNSLMTTVDDMAQAISALMPTQQILAAGGVDASNQPLNTAAQAAQALDGWNFRQVDGKIVPATPEQKAAAQRGGAMLLTSMIPGTEAMLPAESFFSKALTGKVLALAAHSASAGFIYGGVAPLENGQSRWDSMTSNAVDWSWQGPVFHGVFKALAWPLGKAVEALGLPQKVAAVLNQPGVTPEIAQRAAADVQEVLDHVRANGANPADIPEDIKQHLVVMSVQNAIDHPPELGVTNLDQKTADLNKAAVELQAPRDVNLDQPGASTGNLGLTAPHDVKVADVPPGYGQTRVAQGVYQNPDGSVEAYGYRGVSPVYEGNPHDVGNSDYRFRQPDEPGMAGTIFISPHPVFASAFADGENVYSMGAKFKNPLIIDDWHSKLPDRSMEDIAQHTTKTLEAAGKRGRLIHPVHGDVGFLGVRQPGVIDAARAMGHDGIIVRHGLESVEIVALHPSTVYNAGAADHISASNTPIADPVQRTIAEKSQRVQMYNGKPVKDLGGTTYPVTNSAEALSIIEQHNQIAFDAPGLNEYGGLDGRIQENYTNQHIRDAVTGTYRLGDKVYDVSFVPTGEVITRSEYNIQKRGMEDVKYPKYEPRVEDVTGKVGRDPTIHPDIAQAALLHDAISKAGVDVDLMSGLGENNQIIAQKLAGFEPAPKRIGTQSLTDKLANRGRRAMDAAGNTHIDDALLDLTAPHEIGNLDRPELSNPGGVRTKFPSQSMHRDLSRIEQGLGPLPPGHKWITTESLMKANLKGEAAMDGRIFAETVDEHIRNAQQMLSLGDNEDAAKRLRWAFEKNPAEAARLMDRDTRLVKLNESPEMIAQNKLAQVKLQPWEVDVLKQYNSLMQLVTQMDPSQIERTQGFITEVLENARAREAGAPKMGEDQVGMVHVAPATQEKAPWSPVPAGVSVPQIPTDWAMLSRMEEELRNRTIEKIELPGVQIAPPRPTKRSSLTGRPVSTNKVGTIDAKLIFRIASGGTSGLLNYGAANTDDPSTRKWLYMAGGVTAALALMPEKGGWFDKSMFGKALMRMNDLPALMRSEVGIAAADKLRDATDIANYFVGTAKRRAIELNKAFPSVAEKELLARAIDDPNNAAVWGKLTPDQQQIAGREGIINHQMGQMLKARGIIDNFREHYVSHIFPKETYNAWRTAKGSLSGGGFTKPRAFDTLQDAENWARANNLPGPILDGPQLQARHLLEVGRAVMGEQITRDMKGMGLLINRLEGEIPVGWVTPRVGGMHDLIAPKSVAIALERLGNYRPGILDSAFLQGLDTAKGWIMRSVMAFPWIHGVNIARSAMALDGTGLAYNRAMDALQAGDPSVARALKHGVMLYDRPDYADKHAQGFQAMLEKVGSQLPDALNNATFQGAANFLKRGETALWDKWVPALGLGSFNIEMHNWTERTGGKFAEGTPEFRAAARTAADNANLKMGKSLQMLKDPGLVYMLRNIFFAPQWMESRIRITMASLGEFRGVATGQIPLSEVKMLPDKIRGLLIGATFTYIASRLWSGQAPQFNPNNSKFYIRTGVYDANKREVGVDLAGWYADDIKLFSDPAKYFMNRLSPMIQIVHTGISGRDAFGRSIGGLELADQTINELGPAGSMVDAAARFGLQGQVTGADAIKGVLSSSDIGSSASLPKPADLKLQMMAYRVLQKYNLPTDDDHIYELQQMIGSNIRRGKEPLDDAVQTYLAYQRRSYQRQMPKSAAVRYLWRQTQNNLRDLAK